MCRRSAIAAVGGFAVAFAIGCGPPRAPNPSVVLIVSDTLRADAVDCERQERRTPSLCALARRGVAFDAAYATAPWTFPSVVSLFTGSHAASYGAPSEGPGDAGAAASALRVPDGERLLAEALADRGYEAVRFVEAGVGLHNNAFQGLAEPDFDPERALRDASRALPALLEDESIERYPMMLGALQYLSRVPADRPFFLVVWIRDPHAVYDPPVKYLNELVSLPVRLPRTISFYTGLGHWDRPDLGLRKLREHAPFTRVELSMLVRLYQMEVRSVDERVGHLLAMLRVRGREDGTIRVFTSDHGEAFGEHGGFLHGHSLYEELLHVPLLLAGPGVPEGRRVSRRVSQIDLMPTLRDLLGADGLESAQGRSLRPLLAGRAGGEPTRPVFAGSPQNPKVGDALVGERFKLILSADGSAELYDLTADPRERVDVSGERPEVRDRMRRELEAIRAENQTRRRRNRARSSEASLRESAEGTRQQLRALGYIE